MSRFRSWRFCVFSVGWTQPFAPELGRYAHPQTFNASCRMTTFLSGLLFLHVAAGFTALLAGFVALLTRKGQRYHLWSGRVYFWSMALVASSALPLAVLRPNVFLFAVAIFSFYLAFTGYRVVIRRRRGQLGRATWLDRTAIACLLLASTGLLLYGFGPGNGDIAAIVFGGIGGLLGIRDLRGFSRAPASGEVGEWWRTHMIGMLGAYIATFTAFVVTNATFLPVLVRWLGPTLLGSIGIMVWLRRYRRQRQQSANAGRS